MFNGHKRRSQSAQTPGRLSVPQEAVPHQPAYSHGHATFQSQIPVDYHKRNPVLHHPNIPIYQGHEVPCSAIYGNPISAVPEDQVVLEKQSTEEEEAYFGNGDLNRLINGMDIEGQICGLKNGNSTTMVAFPTTLYVSATEAAANETLSVTKLIPLCVSECARVLSIESCPYDTDLCKLAENVEAYKTDRFGKFCLPQNVEEPVVEIWLEDVLPESSILNFVRDTFKLSMGAWELVAVSTLAGVVFAVLYIVLVRYFATTVVIVGILGIAVAAAGGGTVLHVRALDDDAHRFWLMAASYSSWAGGLVFLFLIFCLARRIRESLAVITTAAGFAGRPSPLILTLTFAFIRALGSCGVVLTFGLVLTRNSVGRMTWDVETKLCAIGLLFGWLWFSAFLDGLLQITTAGAVSIWYHNWDGSDRSPRAKYAVCRSMKIAFQYHLGSAALGSLILSFLRFIKWFFRILAFGASFSQRGSIYSPMQLPVIGHILRVFVWIIATMVHLFEKFFGFITRNAYIQVAITGKGFFESAANTFSLIFQSPGRWAVAAVFAKFLRMLGHLGIAAGVGAIAYFLAPRFTDSVSWHRLKVTLLCSIVGYISSGNILSLLAATTDSTHHCYILDVQAEANGVRRKGRTPAPLASLVEQKRSLCCAFCC